jgi:hypothetical protein
MRCETLLAERRATLETTVRLLTEEIVRELELLARAEDMARQAYALRAAANVQLVQMGALRARLIMGEDRLARQLVYVGEGLALSAPPGSR